MLFVWFDLNVLEEDYPNPQHHGTFCPAIVWIMDPFDKPILLASEPSFIPATTTPVWGSPEVARGVRVETTK